MSYELMKVRSEAEDKLLGMWLGHALGDALGMPYEFAPTLPYCDELCYAPVHHRRFQTSQHGVVGQVSDDTEMTLALLRAILTARRYEPETALTSYLAWAQQAPFCGKNTRALLKGVTTLSGAQGRWQKQFSNPQVAENAQSNGCLMRATPLLFFPEAAQTDCYLTNPNQVCSEAVGSYLFLLRSLYAKVSPVESLTAMLGKLQQPLLLSTAQTLLNENRLTYNPAEKRGWIVHAWSLALQTTQLLNNEQLSYSQLMRQLIQNHIYGDTDTNAAIGGALFGMARGLSGLLADPVTKANLEIMLSANTATAELARPADYHPRNYFAAAPIYLALSNPSA